MNIIAQAETSPKEMTRRGAIAAAIGASAAIAAISTPAASYSAEATETTARCGQ
ncbi:hypothetical protein [Clavibacter michiganensis]|uniref:hypothetical protein n=1 Tax=Clavibacter michiganensis TaxID=28447 RepID=UPI001BE034F6|nr:hypothetical protein [Clavibacter michiganensis]MBT1634723.1 hypothetical protein [Clavibacter michiganensis]